MRPPEPLPSLALDAHRDEILESARRNGLTNVRVFGSVARGEDHTRSDIDLVVTANPGTSLLEVSGFRLDVMELTGCEVDVITDGPLNPDSPILTEAVTL